MQRAKRPFQEQAIEINSSPEPEPQPCLRPVRARSTSKTRATSAQANAKGKGKASSQSSRKTGKVALGPVIELTDSEPELMLEPGPSRSIPVTKERTPRIRSNSNALQAKAVGASTLSENIPVASGSGSGAGSSKKRKVPAPVALPLFLQSQSDEENEPPFFSAERTPKRANRGDKEREVSDVEDDWDPEFANKPFPFQYQYFDDQPRVMLAPAPAPVPTALPAPPVVQPQPVQPAPVAQVVNPVPVPAPVPVVQQAFVAQLPALVPAPVPAPPVRPAPVVQLPAPAPAPVPALALAPVQLAPVLQLPAPAPVPALALAPVQPAPVLQLPAPAPVPALAPPPAVQPAPVAQLPAHVPLPAPGPPAEPAVPANPEPDPDPTSRAIAQILEIIPDVEPEHLLGLVHTHLPNFAGQTVEHILGLLFEDGGYPRADPRGKGKRKADPVDPLGEEAAGRPEGGVNGGERPNKKVKVDYASVDRPLPGGPMYNELALVQLQTSFPHIPKPFIRQALQRHRGLYAPTYLALAVAEKSYIDGPLHTRPARPYVLKSTRYNPSKDRKKMRAVVDEAFAEERKWLVEHLQDPDERDAMTVGTAVAGVAEQEVAQQGTGKGKEKAVGGTEGGDEHLEEGTGIECQCCFAEYAFDKMVQCPEAHLFCNGCVSQYASTKLGEHDHLIVCMHESGCAQPFPPSELRRILPQKLMDLYERVKQQKEIQAAGLEGLEECPFCEWKCVLEVSNEEEKLFRCGNEEGGCGVVSCRLCKKKDHLPKTCKEIEEDKLLDGRHAIEEAMTRALMRNCPKCQKAFVKDQGCNKMTCPNCRTLSCYVCRNVITGYDHFNQAPPGRATSSKAGGKCLLWDQVEERHVAEVKAAAEKAMEEYKRTHPDVDEKDIKVDLPVAPPPPPQPQPVPLVAQVAAQHGWYNPQIPQPVNPAWGGLQMQFNFPGYVGPAIPQPAFQALQMPPPQVLQQPQVQQQRAQLRQAVRQAQQAQQEQRRLRQQQRQELLQREIAQRQAQLARERENQLAQQQYMQQLREYDADVVARANAQYHEQLRLHAQQVERDARAKARQVVLERQERLRREEIAERQRFYQEALIRREEERAREARARATLVAPPVPVVHARAPAKKKARR